VSTAAKRTVPFTGRVSTGGKCTAFLREAKNTEDRMNGGTVREAASAVKRRATLRGGTAKDQSYWVH